MAVSFHYWYFLPSIFLMIFLMGASLIIEIDAPVSIPIPCVLPQSSPLPGWGLPSCHSHGTVCTCTWYTHYTTPCSTSSFHKVHGVYYTFINLVDKIQCFTSTLHVAYFVRIPLLAWEEGRPMLTYANVC